LNGVEAGEGSSRALELIRREAAPGHRKHHEQEKNTQGPLVKIRGEKPRTGALTGK